MMPQLFVHSHDDELHEYVRKIALRCEIPERNHFHIFPEKTILTIDQAREIQDIALHVHEQSIIIIAKFDTAREDTQNALLKTLEDLTEKVIFVLGVNDTSAILPTILSRCEVVLGEITRVDSGSLIESYGLSLDGATYTSYLSASTYITKEDAPRLVDELIFAYRTQYLKDTYDGYSQLMRQMLEIRRHIIYAHITPEVAIDVLGHTLLSAGKIPLSRVPI
jgi:DNA polymerase III, delta subunit